MILISFMLLLNLVLASFEAEDLTPGLGKRKNPSKEELDDEASYKRIKEDGSQDQESLALLGVGSCGIFKFLSSDNLKEISSFLRIPKYHFIFLNRSFNVFFTSPASLNVELLRMRYPLPYELTEDDLLWLSRFSMKEIAGDSSFENTIITAGINGMIPNLSGIVARSKIECLLNADEQSRNTFEAETTFPIISDEGGFLPVRNISLPKAVLKILLRIKDFESAVNIVNHFEYHVLDEIKRQDLYPFMALLVSRYPNYLFDLVNNGFLEPDSMYLTFGLALDHQGDCSNNFFHLNFGVFPDFNEKLGILIESFLLSDCQYDAELSEKMFGKGRNLIDHLAATQMIDGRTTRFLHLLNQIRFSTTVRTHKNIRLSSLSHFHDGSDQQFLSLASAALLADKFDLFKVTIVKIKDTTTIQHSKLFSILFTRQAHLEAAFGILPVNVLKAACGNPEGFGHTLIYDWCLQNLELSQFLDLYHPIEYLESVIKFSDDPSALENHFTQQKIQYYYRDFAKAAIVIVTTKKGESEILAWLEVLAKEFSSGRVIDSYDGENVHLTPSLFAAVMENPLAASLFHKSLGLFIECWNVAEILEIIRNPTLMERLLEIGHRIKKLCSRHLRASMYLVDECELRLLLQLTDGLNNHSLKCFDPLSTFGTREVYRLFRIPLLYLYSQHIQHVLIRPQHPFLRYLNADLPLVLENHLKSVIRKSHAPTIQATIDGLSLGFNELPTRQKKLGITFNCVTEFSQYPKSKLNQALGYAQAAGLLLQVKFNFAYILGELEDASNEEYSQVMNEILDFIDASSIIKFIKQSKLLRNHWDRFFNHLSSQMD